MADAPHDGTPGPADLGEYARRRAVFQRALCGPDGALSEAGEALLRELADLTRFWEGGGPLGVEAANYERGAHGVVKTILNTLAIDPVAARRRLQTRIERMETQDG